jgi:hypothetical protein
LKKRTTFDSSGEPASAELPSGGRKDWRRPPGADDLGAGVAFGFVPALRGGLAIDP